jgi:hypothetical protein
MTPGPWVNIGMGVYQANAAGDREIVLGWYMTRSAAPPEREANARAIAALPELMEAARSAEAALSVLSKGPCEPYRGIRVQLRRILARIDGGDNA